MAKLRSDMESFEVYPELTSDEFKRLAKSVVYGSTEAIPVVPVEYRATGMAAVIADAKCLDELSRNASARFASMALSGNSSLGM